MILNECCRVSINVIYDRSPRSLKESNYPKRFHNLMVLLVENTREHYLQAVKVELVVVSICPIVPV